MIFADWAAALARAAIPAFPIPTTVVYPFGKPDDPRFEPVCGDEIDELVNEQLARGKADRR